MNGRAIVIALGIAAAVAIAASTSHSAPSFQTETRARRWLWRCTAVEAEAVNVTPDENDPALGRGGGNGGHGGRDRDRDRGREVDRGWHRPSFSVATNPDLEIVVTVPDAIASLPVRVELYTPRGKLYQILQAVAATDSSSTRDGGQDTSRRGPRRHLRSLAARFPVAGTQITSHALYGEWRAEAYLGDADTPCSSRPVEFVIEP